MKLSVTRSVRAGWLPPARELRGWAAAALGRRAAETIRSQTGATARTLEAIAPLLSSSSSPAPAQSK